MQRKFLRILALLQLSCHPYGFRSTTMVALQKQGALCQHLGAAETSEPFMDYLLQRQSSSLCPWHVGQTAPVGSGKALHNWDHK